MFSALLILVAGFVAVVVISSIAQSLFHTPEIPPTGATRSRYTQH